MSPTPAPNFSALQLLARPLLAAAVGFAVLIDDGRAEACSCMAPPPPKEAAHASAAVFEGRVTRIEDPEGEPTVHFQVVRSFKGPTAESIAVRTANNSAACGYGFEPEQSYLVYANEEGGALTTGLCTRTRPIGEAGEDLAELGLGVTPFDPGSGSEEAVPPHAPAGEAKKGGCASCSIGARASMHEPSLTGVALLALAIGYRITSRRRSGSRS